MPKRTVFAPFINLGFNAGRINPSGLTRADGVIHGGAGYLGTPPAFVPTSTDFTAIPSNVSTPIRAHVNLAARADNDDFAIFLEADGSFYMVNGSVDAVNWPITAEGSISSIPEADEAGFISFGPNEVFAAGTSEPVQIFQDGDANFGDCFTSTDKPKAKYVAVLDYRLLFANIANTGTAGNPDPNGSLLWWGATNNAKVIGNEESHPKDLTGFVPISDTYGDITGLSSGKDRAPIFKDSAVYEIRLGGSYGYIIDRIATGVGLRYPHSIAELGGDTYFYSTLGPAVIRNGQVLLLGNGYLPLRDIFKESPSDPELAIIGTGVDVENGLVCWLMSFKVHPYRDLVNLQGEPYEAEDAAITTYALLVYNAVSNQLSFAFRITDSNGFGMVDESSPTTPHKFIPLGIVDRIPWRNPLPLNGVGIIAIESPTTNSGTRYPRLFCAGLSGTNFTPDWTIKQNIRFETGYIPFEVVNGKVVGVRPILRTRRASSLPNIKARVRTIQGPTEPDRVTEWFSLREHGDRRGTIAIQRANVATFASIELEIEARSFDPVAYAFLVNEIEGIEVDFMDAGKG